LQLRFPDEQGFLLPLPWRTSRSEIKPHNDDGHRFPAVFAVQGRSAQQHFIEFGGPLPGLTFEACDYRVRIQARLGHRKGWTDILDFMLRAGHISAPEQYIAYGNSPNDLTPDDIAKATAALRQLMERMDALRAQGESPTSGD
jgi:hypothetical protein